jgi:uncharacterized membrane protein YedE/YeeE
MNFRKKNFVALVSGTLFGFGLALSEMVNPDRVLNFLDLLGQWDPTLAFVMAGAIPVSAIGYLLIRKRESPLFDERFRVPDSREIDKKLIGGAVLFGVGWGIAGYCPGPAVAMLSLQWQEPLVFLGFLALGSFLCRSMTR